MSTVSSVTSPYAASSQTQTTGSTTTAVGVKTLGQDDFLRLLAQQFQSQDPMKPMDDTSFISQMAQFTSLQQTSTMSKDISALKAEQNVATANSYLGHNVTVDDGNGGTARGSVSAIKMVDGNPQLVVGAQTYPLSSVIMVEPTAVSSASTSTPTTGQ